MSPFHYMYISTELKVLHGYENIALINILIQAKDQMTVFRVTCWELCLLTTSLCHFYQQINVSVCFCCPQVAIISLDTDLTIIHIIYH